MTTYRVVASLPLELTDTQARDIFNQFLVTLGGGKDCFIGPDGKIYETTDYGHGSPHNELVQNPSDVQRLALELKDALKDERARASRER